MESQRAQAMFVPRVNDHFEGFDCRECGVFVPSWWHIFSHFAWHLEKEKERFPEDELTC